MILYDPGDHLSRTKFLTNGDEGQLAKHVYQLRAELRSIDPTILAALTATDYRPTESGHNIFSLNLWGRATEIIYPEYIGFDQKTGEELPVMSQALLAYYFYTADGTSPAGKWISFSELPDGRFYNQAFQGYTGREIFRSFQDDVDALGAAAETLPRALPGQGGPSIGDSSFSFQALPRVSLLVAYWRGDEDFPSSYKILFNAAILHYLPTDVCAILGSMLTRKLINLKKKTPD